jgi:transglutaminase-like putative cysteine protease
MRHSPFALRFFLPDAVVAVGIILLTGAATSAAASLFGSKDAPLPQWGQDAARTPTPAYAGESASVVLYDEYVETIDEQGRATEREREAVRILKPQGREHAGCVVAYDTDQKINYFREWTLTADGKIFEARDTDFVDVGDDTGVPVMLFAGKNRVVRPPAADVGATVICESEELMAPYTQEKPWFVQSSVPVVFEALELDLPQGRAHAEDWHNQEPVKGVEVAPNHWRWEVKDEHALDVRDVPSRPSREALRARMTVEWGDAAVAGIDNQWHALGQWFTRLEAGRPDATPEIAAEAQKLIAGTTDFYGKLAAITSYIQKNVRYFIVVRGIGGLQAHSASDIFHNRFGDCKDKSTLLIAMLQTAGIQAFYMPVDDQRGVVDPKDPSLVGDHMITAIEVPAGVNDARLQAVVTAGDGKRYLIFDPTNERTPVGNLPSYEQGSYGLLAAGAASQVMALPVLDPAANGTTQTGKFTLLADGTLSGSVDAAHIGPEGADYRLLLKYTDEKERHDAWETRVARDLPGGTLESFAFVQPEALDKPVEFHYKVTAPGYAHTAGTLLLVRPRVVGTDRRPCDDKPRTLPIDLEATGRWQDSFDIALPAGYAVDELPDPVDVETDFASYHSKATTAGNVLHYEREYVVRKVEIPASEGGAFRKLEGEITEDEQAAAVLKRQ